MSTNTHHHTSRGYTLIELLLYVTLVGILLGSIGSLFATFVEARVKNQSVVEVTQQGTLAMDTIARAIRGATSITSPTAGNSAAALTVVSATGNDSPIVVDLSSSVLRIKKGTGSAIALTNGKVQVSGLSFTNLTPSGADGVVRITFTVTRVNTPNQNAYDYQKTFNSTATLRVP